MTLAEKKTELAAVTSARARYIIEQLPTPGAKAWMQHYISALQEDIAAEQSAVNQSAAADRERDSPTSGFYWRPILQTIGEVAWAAIKKHWPTASIATGLSALVSLGINYLSK